MAAGTYAARRKAVKAALLRELAINAYMAMEAEHLFDLCREMDMDDDAMARMIGSVGEEVGRTLDARARRIC